MPRHFCPHFSTVLTIIIFTALGSGFTPSATAQCPKDKITSDVFRDREKIAFVEAFGPWLAAASNSPENDNNVLRTYFFRANLDGQFEFVSFVESPSMGDAFGSTLALWSDQQGNDIAVVGDQLADSIEDDHGAVHVYRYNDTEFVFEQTLTPFATHEPTFGADRGDQFGESIATNGDRIIVGSSNEEGEPHEHNGFPLHAHNRVGAAYVFKYDGQAWQPEQKLMHEDGEEVDRFGSAVAIGSGLCEGHILVGAVAHDDPVAASGAVFAFQFDEQDSRWVQTDEFVPADVGVFTFFGKNIDLHASSTECVAAIAAGNQTENQINRGAVYLYRFNPESNTWIEEQNLTPHDADVVRALGDSVAIWGDYVSVSAGQVEADGVWPYTTFKSYVFKSMQEQTSSWTEQRTLIPPGTAEHRSVSLRGAAVSEHGIFATVPEDSEFGNRTGAILQYDFDAPYILGNESPQSFANRAFSRYIDPRIESDDGITINRGIDHCTIAFSEPVHDMDGSDLTANAFTIEQTGMDEPPTIERLATSDNQTVTLFFDRLITVGQWTTIRATVVGESGQSTCGMHVGFLPGDINQDGRVRPDDLFQFRRYIAAQTVLVVGALGDYLDMDRNLQTTPLDLFRYRQIILGVSPATQAWQLVSLPEGPPR